MIYMRESRIQEGGIFFILPRKYKKFGGFFQGWSKLTPLSLFLSRYAVEYSLQMPTAIQFSDI